MRRISAVVCCAAYLVFGPLAGHAHVHGAASHHAEARGLHLDHAHLSGIDSHNRSGFRSTADVEARHVGHHDGDAVDLSAWAVRVLANARVLPAIFAGAATTEQPSDVSATLPEGPRPPRGPPTKIPPRLRAPPA